MGQDGIMRKVVNNRIGIADHEPGIGNKVVQREWLREASKI